MYFSETLPQSCKAEKLLKVSLQSYTLHLDSTRRQIDVTLKVAGRHQVDAVKNNHQIVQGSLLLKKKYTARPAPPRIFGVTEDNHTHVGASVQLEDTTGDHLRLHSCSSELQSTSGCNSTQETRNCIARRRRLRWTVWACVGSHIRA